MLWSETSGFVDIVEPSCPVVCVAGVLIDVQ